MAALSHNHPARLESSITEVLCRIPGLDEVTIWLADMGYTELRDLAGAGRVEIDGSLPGRCFSTKQIIEVESAALAPIDAVGRTIGVLEVRGEGVSSLAPELPRITTVIANRLVATKGQSDEVEMKRGAGFLDIAATIQHELMPIPSFSDDATNLGGQIEPAYDIAGDAFDYAINNNRMFVGLFDAVGHGLRSALLTTIAVGTYRLGRRRQMSLADIADFIDETLNGVTEAGEFVTGVIGVVDLDTRALELANAGHLPPVLIRDGHSHEFELDPVFPLGIARFSAKVTTTHLQPGDAIYLFSDGIVESHDRDRQQFGTDRLFSMLEQFERDEIPVQKVCKDVLSKVKNYVGGPLRDDATIFGLRLIS